MEKSYPITSHSTYRLPFPHLVNYEPAKYKQIQTGTRYNNETRKDEPVFQTVMDNGVLSIVCNPNNIVQVGDVLDHPRIKGVMFQVSEVTEPIKAKGDWSFVDFEPVIVNCSVIVKQ